MDEGDWKAPIEEQLSLRAAWVRHGQRASNSMRSLVNRSPERTELAESVTFASNGATKCPAPPA